MQSVEGVAWDYSMYKEKHSAFRHAFLILRPDSLSGEEMPVNEIPQILQENQAIPTFYKLFLASARVT